MTPESLLCVPKGRVKRKKEAQKKHAVSIGSIDEEEKEQKAMDKRETGRVKSKF